MAPLNSWERPSCVETVKAITISKNWLLFICWLPPPSYNRHSKFGAMYRVSGFLSTLQPQENIAFFEVPPPFTATHPYSFHALRCTALWLLIYFSFECLRCEPFYEVFLLLSSRRENPKQVSLTSENKWQTFITSVVLQTYMGIEKKGGREIIM